MKPDTRSFYARTAQAAIEHIAQHLDDALELKSLARLTCLSPFPFHRVFRGMVGETPLEFARRFRLRTYPRIEIAAACGVHFDAEGAIPASFPATQED
jgi:transcriptional regulator GlxA family with amidase domain